MNSIVKSCAFAAILSLSMVPAARSMQLDSKVASSVKPTAQNFIIAQKDTPVELGQSTMDFFDELIVMNMKMVSMAQKMLDSQGSTMSAETRTMVQGMITSGNEQIRKLVGEREKLFRANRLGR